MLREGYIPPVSYDFRIIADCLAHLLHCLMERRRRMMCVRRPNRRVNFECPLPRRDQRNPIPYFLSGGGFSREMRKPR